MSWLIQLSGGFRLDSVMDMQISEESFWYVLTAASTSLTFRKGLVAGRLTNPSNDLKFVSTQSTACLHDNHSGLLSVANSLGRLIRTAS